MGKATITGGGDGGLYTAILKYRTDTIDAQIVVLEARVVFYEDKILELEDGREKNVVKAQLLGIEKRIEYLEALVEEASAVFVWCADYTEDLSGDVGVVYIPGQTQFYNLYPGYENAAVYDIDTHGFLMPSGGLTPAQAFVNLGLLPAWQKWKPTFRYATITVLEGDTCSITLEDAISTQQGLDVNQGTTLEDVPISYMGCDGFAFSVGDSVLVKFLNQDFASPEVVGFKDNPRPCRDYLLYRTYDTEYSIDECVVYDLLAQAVAVDIPDGSGGLISFPCEYDDLVYWVSNTTEETNGSAARGGTNRSSIIYESIDGSESATETWTDTMTIGGETFNNTKTAYQQYSEDPDALETSKIWGFECISGMGSSDAHLKLSYNGAESYERENDYDSGDTACTLYMAQEQDMTMNFSSSASSVEHHQDTRSAVFESSWTEASGTWVNTVTNCSYAAEYLRSLTPYFYLSYIKTETFFLLFGTVTSGWAIRIGNGDCTTFCGGIPSAGYDEERQPWKQTFLVDSEYNMDGLTESFTPADATSSIVGDLINTFLQGVYSQYLTNGFPEMADFGIPTGGPAWQLTHEVSIRK